MKENLREIQRLLHEVVVHLKTGTKPASREAATKLTRIAGLASTSALTIQARRST